MKTKTHPFPPRIISKSARSLNVIIKGKHCGIYDIISLFAPLPPSSPEMYTPLYRREDLLVTFYRPPSPHSHSPWPGIRQDVTPHLIFARINRFTFAHTHHRRAFFFRTLFKPFSMRPELFFSFYFFHFCKTVCFDGL